MKKLIFMLLLTGSIQGIYAQKAEKKDKFSPNTPLFEELTDVKKKTDKFNLYLNMQGSFDAHFRDGFQEGDFNMHQLRIEAKGNINNWLSYRYRQRLNRSNDANGMIDNLPTSIDYAGIGIQLNEQFSLFAGKQCAAYGRYRLPRRAICTAVSVSCGTSERGIRLPEAGAHGKGALRVLSPVYRALQAEKR